jgi:purine-binding chemotaxis protein CheW
MQTPPAQISPDGKTANLLRARSAALAAESAAPEQPGSRVDLILFESGLEKYAVEAQRISEICRFEDMTPLPGLPAFFDGLINLRGHVVPVMNLQSLFGRPRGVLSDTHVVMLAETNDTVVGIAADSITGLIEVGVADITAMGPNFVEIESHFVKGQISDLSLVLDLQAILSSPAILINQPAE